MARIRTIKPEFWTDSKIVRLPYEARLFFVGLWNFADDEGFVGNDPEQLRLQILPSDPVDAGILIDLLVAAELVEVVILDGGATALKVPTFGTHQRISHPSPSKIAGQISGKRRNIPAGTRRLLAEKYGLEPGQCADVSCHYCGEVGKAWWPLLSSGKPCCWVGFSLAIDHFVAESQGGSTTIDNLVLACEFCHKSKETKDGFSRGLQRTPEDSARKGKERKGRERKGKEEHASACLAETKIVSPTEPPLLSFPCDGPEKTWHLTRSQVDRFRELFPSLDILAEARAALAWVEADSTRRKTAKGMTRYLTGWLTRSQNRGGASRHGFQQPARRVARVSGGTP